MKISKEQKLVECAVLIGLATVLSVLKLVDMPYGGSVTFASMLPLVILAYRHGLTWGLGSGLVYGVVQQLLGLKNLSYVTGAGSVIALILLDYLVAFTVIGFAALAKKAGTQTRALVFGSVIACALRFLCHVISGATVWAGLSIPTGAALVYSLSYNATYMIPETIVCAVAAAYLSRNINFSGATLTRATKAENNTALLTDVGVGGLITAAIIVDLSLIFSKLQNADSGELDFAGLANVKWVAVAVITGVVAIACVVAILLAHRKSDEE